ncbi:hypothetical protein NMG60_11031754 [Bertholletia excelsa]
MSRCFPFPPPGYEKKARIDDAELLKKEKHREKKHKKEDKEKREGKEKREKDRSDGKHRDRKEKKEKHRDKKKEKKDREKDKDKSSTSTAGPSESFIGEKSNHKEKEWGKGKSNISNEEQQGHAGQKPVQNSLLSEGAGDAKFVQELDRRIRDEKGAGSQLVERSSGSKQKNDEQMVRTMFKDTGFLPQGRETNKEKRIDNRKINDQRIRDDTRSISNAVVSNFTGVVQNRVEGLPRPLENMERMMEEREKSKERDGDEKRGDKRKDKNKEKKSHGKDKDRDKEKKKKEKVKEISDHKSMEHDKPKNVNRSDILGTQNIKTLHMSKDGEDTAAEGNLKKRKDFEANGFLHETEVRPNKIPKSIPHLSTVNGRKLEPCQTSTPLTSDRQEPPNNIKVDIKERKLNGVVEAQSLPTSSKKTSPAIVQGDQISPASLRSPHPDSKYLNQLLSVPTMEEWSDFDDQEWLFSSKSCSSGKPIMGTAGDVEAPVAWAEALQIESADIYALPYVVPF